MKSAEKSGNVSYNDYKKKTTEWLKTLKEEIPNAETQKAIKEAREKKTITYSSLEEFKNEMHKL